MIHHVSLELDEHDVAAEVAFWELLGFSEMTPPGALFYSFQGAMRARC